MSTFRSKRKNAPDLFSIGVLLKSSQNADISWRGRHLSTETQAHEYWQVDGNDKGGGLSTTSTETGAWGVGVVLAVHETEVVARAVRVGPACVPVSKGCTQIVGNTVDTGSVC